MASAPLHLTRTFSITSFIGIALLSIALGVLYQWVAENTLITHESESNADLALALSNALPDGYQLLIQRAAQLSVAELRSDPQIARLQEALEVLLKGLRVSRVKIYDHRRRLIFTTVNQQEVGHQHHTGRGVDEALGGEVYSRLVPRAHRSDSHLPGHEGGEADHHPESLLLERLMRWLDFGLQGHTFMASYVPLRSGEGEVVIGVLEIYSDITTIVRSKDRSGVKILSIIMVMMLLLYLFLLLIVRRAEHIITAHERLTRNQQEERIRYLAHHDELTGLPNRALFGDLLSQSLQQGAGEKCIGVFALGLDRFRVINDSLGHAAGDQVLAKLASRIARAMNGQQKAFRIGGDEFVVVDEFLSYGEGAGPFAERLIGAAEKPMLIDGEEIMVSISVGIALHPVDGGTAEELLNSAMGALANAKRLGGGYHAFHTEGMNTRNRERLELEQALRRALEQGQFELYYQPKVSASQGRVVGMEALLRWHHPQRGMVGPNEFIPLLESTGQMVDVGAWVLTQACRQAARWRDGGLGELQMAVNVSLKQFDNPQHLLATVRGALASSGIAPHLLELELTESILAEDMQQLVDTLSRLKALGVRLAIDDFGTGYSSLSYLTHLPIDTLKIDMSFVRNILEDEQSASITNAIISLARSLGLGVVAEGVESREQMVYISALGCDLLQGYHFSPPCTEGRLAEVVAEINHSL